MLPAFHHNWFYLAVATTGFVGLWGVVLAVRGIEPDRRFGVATVVAVATMLVQVGSGLALYAGGREPGNDFHTFYGVVIVITFALAYVWRAAMARRPALSYGLLLLFVMGLGLRAWGEL